MRTFELTRPTVGAQALGIARAAYEYSLEYAKGRVQFGRPIVENQAIAFTLADMRMEIDAARLLVWRAAWMGRNNRPFSAGEGSMSKLKAGEIAVVGDREGGPDPRRGRLPAGTSGAALVPRREDLHHLRGHLARSSAWSSPAPSAAPRFARSPTLPRLHRTCCYRHRLSDNSCGVAATGCGTSRYQRASHLCYRLVMCTAWTCCSSERRSRAAACSILAARIGSSSAQHVPPLGFHPRRRAASRRST